MAPEKVLSLDQVNAHLARQVLRNLVIECTANTQVVIKQDSTIGADDGLAILTAAGDLTLDITNVGVKNGLDTGVEASDTWYYIYLIFNPTTGEVAGLLSASATAPTLPSGFTKKRLVGAVRNDGSSNFKKFSQRNDDVSYSAYQQLAYLVGGPSFVELTLGNFLPWAVAQVIDFGLHIYNGVKTSAGAAGYLSLDGVATTRVAAQQGAVGSLLGNYTDPDSVVLLTSSIWYNVASSATGDRMTILIYGFKLNL